MIARSFCKTADILVRRQIEVSDAQIRLLVVDDDPLLAEASSVFMEHEGFMVRSAGNGVEADLVAIEWHPHLILMDVKLPALSGIDAALLLRSQATTKDIIIIASTSMEEVEVKRLMKDDEFDAYFRKGEPLSGLLGMMHTFVKFKPSPRAGA